MPKIFISYRRSDSQQISGRIYDRLVEEFGKKNVFKDIDKIPLGADFRRVIIQEVSQCNAVLVIIGKSWLSVPNEEGKPRLADPNDFVRIEIETALKRAEVTVIPVLVEGVGMPRTADLPESLRELPYKNAAVIQDDPYFHYDIDRLIDAIKSIPRITKPPKRSGWVFVILAALLVVIFAGLFLLSVFQGDKSEATEQPTDSADLPTNTLRISTATDTLEPTATVTNTSEPSVTPTNTPTKTSTPTLKPTLAPGTVRVDEKGISQVWVPAGCFMMGGDPALDQYARSDEQPQHEVCLTEGYWIDHYEVTNAAFQAFMDDGGYENPNYWSEAGWQWKEANDVSNPICLKDKNLNAPQQPVVCVSWYEAEAYARWRGGSLPTEAQWEYAARGTDGRIFPWGNEFDGTRLNFCDTKCPNDWRDESYDDGYAYTAPVGSYEAGKSWVGAYDMAGNVWEWVADWYSADYYTVSPRENPTGPENGSRRVLRGGSWRSDEEGIRSRSDYRMNSRSFTDGFRMVTAGGSTPQ